MLAMFTVREIVFTQYCIIHARKHLKWERIAARFELCTRIYHIFGNTQGKITQTHHRKLEHDIQETESGRMS